MIRSKMLMSLAAGVLLTSAAAQADTVATFADPSPNGATPLFTLSGNTFSGGWSGLGLNLQTPGLPLVSDYADATFSMSPLNAVNVFGSFWALSGGSINFLDSASNPLLTITFASATLNVPAGAGASDFAANNVTFSGPILSGYALVTNEAFAFSFANPVGAANNFTVTSSFTSSADLFVPAPGAAAVLGLGAIGAMRRRRR